MISIADEAMAHVNHLAREIGNRIIGSPGNHTAAAYIAAQFRQAGLSLEFQQFPCPNWLEESTSLELAGQTLAASANTFSPSCDVAAPTIAIGTFTELQTTPISSHIPIFYGELVQHELAASGAIYVPERDRQIVELLEAQRPPALITINPSLNGRWRLIEDYNLPIPSATVTAPVGLKLVEQAGQTVRLCIATQRSDSHSTNVIGLQPGDRPQRIVLCAHYDTKVDTPGAYDNAAGIAVLLTLLNRLSRTRHRYTLEYVAFSGEEVYGLGDMEYARRTGSGFKQIATAINFDGVGPRIAANTIATYAASRPFEELVTQVKANYPGVAPVEPWPASDHYIFYSNGVPSIALGSVGIKDIFHTPADTVDWISPAKLAEAVMLAQEIVAALDEKEPNWARPT
jgi:aminopeptidase YwaD